MSPAPRESTAIRVARALSDPTRFRLLRAVAARGEVSCRELVARFPLAQATVSHHLKVLAEAGLVTVRQQGSFHYYRAVPGSLEAHGRELARLAAPTRSTRSKGAVP